MRVLSCFTVWMMARTCLAQARSEQLDTTPKRRLADDSRSPKPKANPCPVGYSQLGKVGDDVPGCGLACTWNVANIGTCETACNARADCGSFEYSSHHRICGMNSWARSITSAQTGTWTSSITCKKASKPAPAPTPAPPAPPAPAPKRSPKPKANLPPLTTFSFFAKQKQVLAAKATECKHGSGSNVPADSIFGDLALLYTKYSGGCWTDGRYNNGGYNVEMGYLRGSDGSNYTAYKVHPPTTKATKFVASRTVVYFRTTEASTLNVYTHDGFSFSKVSAESTSANVFVAASVRIDALTSPMVLVFDTSGVPVSTWPRLSSTVDAAWLTGSPGFSISARRFKISGHAFRPDTDWNVGPNSWKARYGIPKKFFPVDRSDGREGVVWQDQTTQAVHMTWFAADLSSADTTTIATGNKDPLVAATSDGSRHIFLVMVSENAPTDKTKPTSATAIKASSSSGAVLITKSLDTSKSGLNIHQYFTSGASMAWNAASKSLGVVVARLMTRGSDGLNHQGAIAIVLDGETLNLIKNFGQTSGHSWANSLTVSKDGTFLGMDLGDNYPRGVHVWRFDNQKKDSFVVYTFKTKHAVESKGRAVYSEISNSETTYYKWSNDNEVYTELARSGLVETNDGILVFFAGERPPLDNTKIGSSMNEPRNVGFVKISKDIAAKKVLSPGGKETGGFYNFGGGWSPQENKGVNFLTSYTSMDECVSRLKTARLSPGVNLLFMEIWTKTSYVRTEAMIVDDNGSVTSRHSVDYPVQLPIADDLRMVGGRAIAYAATAGQIIRYEICAGSSCPQAGKGGGGGTAAATTTTIAAEATTASTAAAAATTTTTIAAEATTASTAAAAATTTTTIVTEATTVSTAAAAATTTTTATAAGTGGGGNIPKPIMEGPISRSNQFVLFPFALFVVAVFSVC